MAALTPPLREKAARYPHGCRLFSGSSRLSNLLVGVGYPHRCRLRSRFWLSVFFTFVDFKYGYRLNSRVSVFFRCGLPLWVSAIYMVVGFLHWCRLLYRCRLSSLVSAIFMGAGFLHWCRLYLWVPPFFAGVGFLYMFRLSLWVSALFSF